MFGKTGASNNLEAGPAMRWRDAIVSPKSMIDKIGVRAADRIYVSNAFDDHFRVDVESRSGMRSERVLRGRFDPIFRKIELPADLARFVKARTGLRPAGALWLVDRKRYGRARA